MARAVTHLAGLSVAVDAVAGLLRIVFGGASCCCLLRCARAGPARALWQRCQRRRHRIVAWAARGGSKQNMLSSTVSIIESVCVRARKQVSVRENLGYLCVYRARARAREEVIN